MKYKLITNKPALFEEQVQHYLDRGWELCGAPFPIVAPAVKLCQAMTLKEDHDVS